MIMNFKVWALMEGLNLPDTDEEILRSLYAKNWDNARAYESMKSKTKFQSEHYPIKFNSDISELLKSGGIYINGRDKSLRPIVILQVQHLINQKQYYGANDKNLFYFIIFVMEYIDKYMLIPGRIENLVLIADCSDVGIFNAPFVAFN